MGRRIPKPWIILLNLGVSGAALLLLFQFADAGQVGTALLSAAPGPLLLATLLNLATRCAAAGRTFTLSRSAGLPVGYSQTVQALFVANFWSLSLPGVSAGSVATVWRYHGRGAGVMQSVAVLSVSRLVEMLAFCLLALVGLATSIGAANSSRAWVIPLLAGVTGAVLLGLGVLRRLGPEARATSRGHHGTGQGWMQRARAGIAGALSLVGRLPRRTLLRAYGWALLQGVLDAATVLLLAIALGIPIGLPQALWINALSYLAILLPVSAAGLGMREVAVLAALLPLGVDRADALALALLMLSMLLFNALAGAAVQLFTPATMRQPA